MRLRCIFDSPPPPPQQPTFLRLPPFTLSVTLSPCDYYLFLRVTLKLELSLTEPVAHRSVTSIFHATLYAKSSNLTHATTGRGSLPARISDYTRTTHTVRHIAHMHHCQLPSNGPWSVITFQSFPQYVQRHTEQYLTERLPIRHRH